MSTTRRGLLRTAGALSGMGLFSSLAARSAYAADTSGYKALVCCFLYGGVDGHDVVLPFDTSSYDAIADIRTSLYSGYAVGGDNNPRARQNMLQLSVQNASNFGGREFALGPEASELHALFESGNAAIVGNVGPLIEPTTRSLIDNGGVALPSKLYSHNDQQSTWMSLGPEGTSTGWGGLLADAVVRSNANTNPAFSAISTAGYNVMLAGQISRQFQLGLDGVSTITELEDNSAWLFGGAEDPERIRAILTEHYRASGAVRTNLFERDMAAASRRAIDNNEAFAQAVSDFDSLPVAFPQTYVGRQLRAIAATIAGAGNLGASRQIFMAAAGGFDTHDNQADNLPDLIRDWSQAIGAFNQNMQALGLNDDVTLFTMSDFGRTLTVNGDGTDHGWGNHHFVVGGAVEGGRIYGDMPPPELETEQDASHGALIPTTSVEQFGATLGRWFGLTEIELRAAFPRLGNFPTSNVGFMG